MGGYRKMLALCRRTDIRRRHWPCFISWWTQDQKSGESTVTLYNKVEGYNYTIKNNKGSLHKDADALSWSIGHQPDRICSFVQGVATDQDEISRWKRLKVILKNPGTERTAKERHDVANVLVNIG